MSTQHTPWVDPVRWFDALGTCEGRCGKPAHGKLMGPKNESYGRYCTACAMKRLNAADKARAIAAARGQA